jgi:nitrogen fixation protein NifU and related proteins
MNIERELYQQIIVDHGKNPRNFYKMEQACSLDGHNPLCGDKVTVYIKHANDIVIEASFIGSGCAIAMASASLMTEVITGMHINKAKELFADFHDALLTGADFPEADDAHRRLTLLLGVKNYPVRVKCATLAWHTLVGILKQEHSVISTE